jgi:uncharacterized alkaline shock family protein YloU
VPTHPTAQIPGRSLVSRRALTDIVRAAALGSYGVTGFAGRDWLAGLAERAGAPPRGIRIGLADELTVELHLTVADRLPIAEVARQVDSAVRYAIRRALGREVDRLTIHVDDLRAGLEAPIGDVPKPSDGRRHRRASTSHSATIAPDDLAASGSDVA